MPQLQFADGLDAASFLAQYWQKQPLLMRNALRDMRLSLSADEIAALALEPDVEARLVSHDGAGRYRLREPPFTSTDFSDLPAENWTLLVQDVDKHLPELAAFVDLFDFVPSWRFDDLMISAAAPGGGVGPHVDQYDVFLCQVTGHRRWSVGAPGAYAERTDSPLRQVHDFDAIFSMSLGPGDVLYLPPGVPHLGVAEDLCTTWSIGFRAPSLLELVEELAPERAQEASDTLRYSDAGLGAEEGQDGLIGLPALARFKRLLAGWVDFRDQELLCRLGRYLTRPKAWLIPEAPEASISADVLARRVREGEGLTRHGMALFARATLNDEHWMFASGAVLRLPEDSWVLAQYLCRQRSYPADALSEYLCAAGAPDLLATLYNRGQLLLEDDL